VIESHTRIIVPRDDAVASSRPDGGTDSVVKALVWAAIIETGCLVGVGGGFGGTVDDGGSEGFGKGQGGR
jgi:hypothetical protein